jgi:pyruvate-formate lyase-activating enzyme
MGYSDIIAYEVETLPPEKQVEILDFIAFLKSKYLPLTPDPKPKTVEEVETFFRSFNTDISDYKFDRDDANAR